MTRHSARFSPPIFFYHLLSFFFLSFPFAPRPIPPLVKLLAPLRSWFLHPFLALADDIRVHLHPIFPSLFSPSLFFLFCFSCLVTELPPLWTFRRGLPFRVSLSIPPFLFPLLFLFFSRRGLSTRRPFNPTRTVSGLTSIFVASETRQTEKRGERGSWRPDPTRIPRDETVNWWLKGTQGIYSI